MVAEVGVQIGLGPSPPPEPALAISSTVPKTNSADHDHRGGDDPAHLDAEVTTGLGPPDRFGGALPGRPPHDQ